MGRWTTRGPACPAACRGTTEGTAAERRAPDGRDDPTDAEASEAFWSNRSGATSTAPQRSSPTPCRLPRCRSVLRTRLSSWACSPPPTTPVSDRPAGVGPIPRRGWTRTTRQVALHTGPRHGQWCGTTAPRSGHLASVGRDAPQDQTRPSPAQPSPAQPGERRWPIATSSDAEGGAGVRRGDRRHLGCRHPLDHGDGCPH